MARGHRVESVPEVPLVVSTEAVANLSKTKAAVALLKTLGAAAEIERVVDSKHLRAGKGKLRNRRYKQALGPLVIYNEAGPLTRAFRNIPGVDLCCVTRLNLLSLAPGGHVGRFVLWTQDAFERLESLYGSTTTAAAEKKGYHVPRSCVTNTDLARIINSIEVQSTLRPKKARAARTVTKRNALTSLPARQNLDPSTIARRRTMLRASADNKAKCAAKVAAKRQLAKKIKKINTPFVKSMLE